MNSFICKHCGKQSKSSGIEQSNGVAYVVCQHENCKAKNRLLQLPTKQGEPLLFEVTSILDET